MPEMVETAVNLFYRLSFVSGGVIHTDILSESSSVDTRWKESEHSGYKKV
jgi:hypothetical protein